MRTTRRRLGTALVVFVLLASGACSDDDSDDEGAGASTDQTSDDSADGTDDSADDGGDEGADVATAEVTAIDFAFEDLPELQTGVTEITLQNDGEVAHEFGVVQLDDAMSIDDFAAAMPAVLEGGPFPDEVGTGIGSPEVEPGESATYQMTLTEPGRYAAFCLLTGDPELGEDEEGAAHTTRGMVGEVTVTEGDGPTEIAGTDGTITAIDYDFEPEVSAGDSTITFTNDGPEQYHFVGVSVYPEGTSADDAEAAFQTLLELPEDAPPPEGTIFPEDVAASGVAGPGVSTTFEVPGGFEAGRTYLLVCFVSDRTGGPPHAIGNGMVHAFTVE
jgi:uncharacterized cupredoxin-like copper-binding protein